eukprot:CAMPEP_0202445842 /NCGR_PEP_ID=MMETSP1360-20130828/4571_1 /ASSEMBLY_ACC=CAM_ASM_000848 /TAXON_ID=515479 /ORGANISM="Licmophora paradoxa, Strain CCMP2313" /LENGTH=238 /DNA_ID=CAMNT_0049062235 /DNA_START=221 /DNA_END=937 /DNA_ORIENTATION=-
MVLTNTGTKKTEQIEENNIHINNSNQNNNNNNQNNDSETDATRDIVAGSTQMNYAAIVTPPPPPPPATNNDNDNNNLYPSFCHHHHHHRRRHEGQQHQFDPMSLAFQALSKSLHAVDPAFFRRQNQHLQTTYEDTNNENIPHFQTNNNSSNNDPTSLINSTSDVHDGVDQHGDIAMNDHNIDLFLDEEDRLQMEQIRIINHTSDLLEKLSYNNHVLRDMLKHVVERDDDSDDSNTSIH